jgi:hypothetical protein
MRADERSGSASLVRCGRCGAGVEVCKFSPEHTSVQWTLTAAGECFEFLAVAPGAPREGCGALRDSIDAAVASGRLPVRAPDE